MRKLTITLLVLLVAHVAMLFVKPSGAASAAAETGTRVGIVFDVGGRGDKSFNEPVPFLGGQKARLLWKASAKRIKPIDVNKYDTVAETIIQTALGKVLDEGADIKAVLTEARTELDKRARR